MARYCIAFDTVKKFSKLKGTESLEELVRYDNSLCHNCSSPLCQGIKIDINNLLRECSAE